MQQKSLISDEGAPSALTSKSVSLQDQSNELLVSIATLGLLAAIADGEAVPVEVDTFSLAFNRSFALKRRQSLRILGQALKRVRETKDVDIFESSCDVLNEHLDMSEKVRVFEELAEVLVADGKVHEVEEYFLECVARKLKIVRALQQRYIEE